MSGIKNDLKHNLILEYVETMIDEDYPIQFNMDEFKKLTSFSQRIKYCEANLSRISSGSGRVVYKIDDEKVLKLAKNTKGVAQNEIEISHSQYNDISDIVARVFDYHQDDLWSEMELARKVRVADFKRITGYDFKVYCEALNYYKESLTSRTPVTLNIPQELYDDMWEAEFTYSIFNYISNYDLPVGDLCRLNSYGLVKRDHGEDIVLIDYGLNNDVYQSYYS